MRQRGASTKETPLAGGGFISPEPLTVPGPPSKYRNVRCTYDGHTFDSQRERDRYIELKLMVKGDEIENLELQPRYDFVVNGLLVCFYKADFRYVDRRTGEAIVEDAKGVRTAVYRIKKKLMRAVHEIDVVEV